MSDDKYEMNIEQGSDFVLKGDRIYMVGKTIGLPEDIGLPENHPDLNMKQALIYFESPRQTASFSLNHQECKQLAEYLMKVWQDSQ